MKIDTEGLRKSVYLFQNALQNYDYKVTDAREAIDNATELLTDIFEEQQTKETGELLSIMYSRALKELETRSMKLQDDLKKFEIEIEKIESIVGEDERSLSLYD